MTRAELAEIHERYNAIKPGVYRIDETFVANARRDILRLLVEVEMLREEIRHPLREPKTGYFDKDTGGGRRIRRKHEMES